MEFQMRFRHSHGNLHIETMGGFDGIAAEKLLQLVRRESPAGGSRVLVVNAELLKDWAGEGTERPTHQKKHKCCGNCAHCTCRQHKHHEEVC